ncbi:uncharacterized protein EURHEDRAFT_414186 [Aspergillus ruber CBS 135680]|uniref:Uncharacterized protein n=1 Tax=Aspergillus ruber (strain CBS 135680) TaxID=1388766 RepID=A0A017SAA9_ASPRC|nr:uncharacterized protein EURHEDRAFT_414186 [Aspergillus ruber CBS 135680]EYE93756.1 hypothetical protein EURHEDRAFT_414186 [Aspergillus ruber CBS 135680]
MPISLLQRRLASDYELNDACRTVESQGVSTMFYTLIQKTLHSVSGGVSLRIRLSARNLCLISSINP